MKFDLNDSVIRPVLSEKSTAMRKAYGKYVFEVNSDVNKSEAKKIIEKMFSVKVLKCNVIKIKGKLKRVKNTYGFRKDWKKMIVTLSKDSKIQFFEGF
jgi:large subunit ribosomal protein L23